MPATKQIRDLMAALQKTTYAKWQKEEGIPVIEGFAIEDLKDVELANWTRTGGKGAFIQLYGMEGVTGMYVAEIPARGMLEPERHLYEEVICILRGQGATEIWHEGGHKHVFEWGPWSVFSPPLNTWHRLVNGSSEPVRLMAVTNAPVMMDVFHNIDFIFNCPYQFLDRYDGKESYFGMGSKRYISGRENIWETNFVPDVKNAGLEDHDIKGAGVRYTKVELSGNALIGHINELPVGKYQKAHYHGPGAVLSIVRSEGYALLWPKEAGIRPYENGRGEEVVQVKWTEGSVYCPPANWFHQHFNTGTEPVRQLAVRAGSELYCIGFMESFRRKDDGVLTDVKDGGTMIEFEDEDPEIRRGYEKALKKNSIECRMPKA